MDSSLPSIDQFADALSPESDWYSLGVFLGAPTGELDAIGINYRGVSNIRCLIELYKCLQSRGKTPSWDFIAKCLRKMNKNSLADRIDSLYTVRIVPSLPRPSSSSSSGASSSSSNPATTEVSKKALKIDVPSEIASHYSLLQKRFTKLNLTIKNAFLKSEVNIGDLQHVIKRQYGLTPFPVNEATMENVFHRLEDECSLLESDTLMFLIDTFLPRNQTLKKQIADFVTAIDGFKSSAKMSELVDLLNKKKRKSHGDSLVIRLKVREFWNTFTIRQFESLMKELIGTLYNHVSNMSVVKGCYCISWIVADIDITATKLIPDHSLQFMKIIGVISLHIGDEVIYSIEEEGCETIEAAMLQAVELKNTRAIELLLAMGCNPEAATYNEENTVTNIVNIREKSSDSSSTSSSVEHVCVLGCNDHIEAIVNPPLSSESECSSCKLKEKMSKHLHYQIYTHKQQADELRSQLQKKEEELQENYEKMRELLAEVNKFKNQLQKREEEVHQCTEEDNKDMKIQQLQAVISSKDDTIQRHETTIVEQREVTTHYRDSSPWLIDQEEVETTEEVVGKGGWSEVKVGVFRGMKVAVKTLYEVILSDYYMQLFSREMEIASSVRHPNIIQFIGATKVGNLATILMELMPTDLRKELQKGQPMTRPQVVAIGIDIGCALNYLHCWKPHPILHRRVSSPNILLEPVSNNRWKAKLADFIAANFLDKIQSPFPGNPLYSAPEASDPSQHSPAMDVYSLGVVMIEMAMATCETPSSMEREIQIQKVKWPAVKDLIHQCMSTDPSARPPTNSVIEQLRNIH